MIERVERSFRQVKGPVVLSEDGVVLMLDQRILPAEERGDGYATARAVAEAIQVRVILGAPARGCGTPSYKPNKDANGGKRSLNNCAGFGVSSTVTATLLSFSLNSSGSSSTASATIDLNSALFI